MNSEYFEVYIGSEEECVGKYMPLQYALILVKAVFSEFYAEPELEVKIKRMYFDTVEDNTVKDIEVITNDK